MQLPCSEVVVARGGKVVYRESAGETKPGVPVNDDSLFRIYRRVFSNAHCHSFFPRFFRAPCQRLEYSALRSRLNLFLHSMTKPITTTALMTLYEEGKFQLEDPIHFYLGDAWRKENMNVFVAGTVDEYTTEPCTKSITMRMVMNHTSGLSYGFDATGALNPVDGLLCIYMPAIDRSRSDCRCAESCGRHLLQEQTWHPRLRRYPGADD